MANKKQDTWYDLFRVAGSCGLSPNEVLDLNLGQLQAYIDGTSDERFNQQCLDIQLAHWIRTFCLVKKPKTPQQYIKELDKERKLNEKAENIGGVVDPHDLTPDEIIEQFEAQRKRFNEGKE